MSFSDAVRDGLPEQVLKVAAINAVIGFFNGQYEQARTDAEAAFRTSRIKKISIALPGGEEVGEITVIQPAPVLSDIDEDAVVGHAEQFTPDEVEEYLDPAALLDQELIEYCREHRTDLLKKRVRPVWRAELKKQMLANDGSVIDKETGQATKVATVTKRTPNGQFALSADKYGARADRLMTELLSGRLGQLVEMPSLETPSNIEAEPARPAVTGFGSGGFADAEFKGDGFGGTS